MTEEQREYFVLTAADTGYSAVTVKWAWEHLKDKLDGYIEYGIRDNTWAADLPYYVTEGENVDGYVDSPYTADAIEWMGEHIDDCAQYYDDEIEFDGTQTNPFKAPVVFICRLYIRLVARLIERTEWFDENCDNSNVTVEDIKQLRTELHMDEETDND